MDPGLPAAGVTVIRSLAAIGFFGRRSQVVAQWTFSGNITTSPSAGFDPLTSPLPAVYASP